MPDLANVCKEIRRAAVELGLTAMERPMDPSSDTRHELSVELFDLADQIDAAGEES